MHKMRILCAQMLFAEKMALFRRKDCYPALLPVAARALGFRYRINRINRAPVVVVLVLETTRPLDSPTYGVDSRWVVCKLRAPPEGGALRLFRFRPEERAEASGPEGDGEGLGS